MSKRERIFQLFIKKTSGRKCEKFGPAINITHIVKLRRSMEMKTLTLYLSCNYLTMVLKDFVEYSKFRINNILFLLHFFFRARSSVEDLDTLGASCLEADYIERPGGLIAI